MPVTKKWSEEKERALCDLAAEHYPTLFPNDKQGRRLSQKADQKWIEIADILDKAYPLCNGDRVQHDVNQVRGKVKNLKALAKEKHAALAL